MPDFFLLLWSIFILLLLLPSLVTKHLIIFMCSLRHRSEDANMEMKSILKTSKSIFFILLFNYCQCHCSTTCMFDNLQALPGVGR